MAEDGPFGTPFLTPKIAPKKFMWVPFLRPFPGNEAHKLFLGGPEWGVSGGMQKVYVEKVYVLFPALTSFVLFRISGDPNPQYFLSKVLSYKWEAYFRTNGRRTAVQMGGVLLGFPFFKA